MMHPFTIIVAIDSNNGIGKDGTLPWSLPEDLKHFKEKTTSRSAKKNVVIMGRKTWDSIPEKFRPLPERINVVVTRNQDIPFPEGVIRAADFENSLKNLKPDVFHQIFVIGGQQVFEEALKHPECEKLIVTHIEKDFNCDTFFPEFENNFTKTDFSELFETNSIKFYFAEYSANQKC